jgi:hypothetical protein
MHSRASFSYPRIKQDLITEKGTLKSWKYEHVTTEVAMSTSNSISLAGGVA